MSVLDQLARFIRSLPIDVVLPTSIITEEDGHIDCEWYWNTSNVVSVSVSPDGSLAWAVQWCGRAESGRVETPDASQGDVLVAIRTINKHLKQEPA